MGHTVELTLDDLQYICKYYDSCPNCKGCNRSTNEQHHRYGSCTEELCPIIKEHSNNKEE